MGKPITELLLVWGALPASLGGPRQLPTSQGSAHFSHIIAAWGPCGESLVALEEPLIMSAAQSKLGVTPTPAPCQTAPKGSLAMARGWRVSGPSLKACGAQP